MGKPNIKTIGVLTSGGDAPAMNAAVRAVARIGKERGLKVKGNSRYDLPWRYNPFHSQM